MSIDVLCCRISNAFRISRWKFRFDGSLRASQISICPHFSLPPDNVIVSIRIWCGYIWSGESTIYATVPSCVSSSSPQIKRIQGKVPPQSHRSSFQIHQDMQFPRPCSCHSQVWLFLFSDYRCAALDSTCEMVWVERYAMSFSDRETSRKTRLQKPSVSHPDPSFYQCDELHPFSHTLE